MRKKSDKIAKPFSMRLHASTKDALHKRAYSENESMSNIAERMLRKSLGLKG